MAPNRPQPKTARKGAKKPTRVLTPSKTKAVAPKPVEAPVSIKPSATRAYWAKKSAPASAAERKAARAAKAELPFTPRERLLIIASQQFAKHGYAATSVRELAETAQVNVGAISYHFEGKEQLYQETLRYVLNGAQVFWTVAQFRQREAARVGTREAAEYALREHIQEFVELLFQQETAFTLMLREFMEPTDALVQVVGQLVGPNATILQELVEQLRPDLKNKAALRSACTSIIGQCVHLRLARALIANLEKRAELDAAYLRNAAEMIANFSIAALRAPATTGTTTP